MLNIEENKENITKKKNDKKRKLINVSLVVFALAIAVFTVLGALVMDNFSHLQQVEELSTLDDTVEKKDIDERLRLIALQEEANEKLKADIKTEEKILDQNNSTENPEEPEEISAFLENEEDLKKTKFMEYNEKYRKKETLEEGSSLNKETSSKETLDEIPSKKESQDISALNMKVVVGNYSTREEAEVELIQISSQFSAPPFIKTINGRYAIQVAAFKTPETAYEFVNSLRQQGFNARIVEE